MKLIVIVLCALLPLFASQDQSRTPEIRDPPSKFDEWMSLPFRDEKARLDNLAIHWQQSSGHVIHIVIYAGKKTCVGESEARWARIRDWLVRERGIPADKITWVNGGYREQPTVTCWLWPLVLGNPPEPFGALSPSEVKILKGCKIFNRRKR